MKIKNSASIGGKTVPAVFCGAAVITLIIRFYQLIFLIDGETGFFKSRNFTVSALYAVIAVSCFAIAFISYLGKERLPDEFPCEVKKPLCAASIVCAAGFVIDFFHSIATAAALNSEGLGTGNITGIAAVMKTGALPTFIQAVLAIPCAVYFIILAVSFGKGSKKYENRKIFALMPVGWGIMRMIRRFVRQISFQNVSDLVLELIMISFMLMFFISFAQIASGVYNKGNRWRLKGFGFPAALLCLITSLPRLVFVLSGQGSKFINANHPLYFCDIAIALFILVLV
ncbi:MAG: hypothetical protein MJ177_10090, partial [Clostridia bacterium]|nr:hypothetical protein [Clostridia bacterium]